MHKTQNIASLSKLYSKRTRFCVSSADELINWPGEPRALDSSSSCDPRFSESLISSTFRAIKGVVHNKTVWTDLAEQWRTCVWNDAGIYGSVFVLSAWLWLENWWKLVVGHWKESVQSLRWNRYLEWQLEQQGTVFFFGQRSLHLSI